ncbi:hypothetical protein LG52_921 [Geobacillus kaustophilus]|uniref:Transposase (putative) YhgA-like domain-containing protein n=1 Tax=Geobacillus kaustophilus TaxID=1462 RepID=A0A0D8BXC9_GEOKU|nr:hypothetical protein LG52_921 [Geobacillus kaustophilus]
MVAIIVNDCCRFYHPNPILRFFPVELRKQNWRNYIRHDNLVAAALLGKMGYTEREKVELKKEFLRMLVRLELDEARQRLLLGFFEAYVKLSEEEERQLQREVKTMETKEKEKVLELIISYEQKGRKEGMKRLIESMARKGMTNDEIARLVDLPVEEIQRLLEE